MIGKRKRLPGAPALPRWTWILPLFIFHMGTGLSLGFRVSPGMSLWYLPVPLGMILIHWWGPRVLLGMYLNAMICAGFWGLYRWWLWPLYALPETLKVALSWWMFTRMLHGKPWLPNLANTWKFLLFGIIIPCGLATFLGQGMLMLLGDVSSDNLLRNSYAEFVLDILSPFAITVPVLLFGTAWMERLGLTLTQGAWPQQSLMPRIHRPRFALYQALAVAGALMGLSVYVPLDKYWFVYGALLIGSALRFGIGAATLASVWTILLTLPLPALVSGHFAAAWINRAELLKVNMNLATVCFAALVVGRALSDVYLEIERRARVEEDLRNSIAEWEKMRNTVREGEDKYRILFESASDAIMLGDNGVIVECNSRALEIYGATREAVIGSPVTRFFPERLEDGSNAEEKIKQHRNAAMTGKPQFFEWRMRRMDGTLFDTEMTFVGVTLEGKRVVMAVIRDISVRKNIERALIESEERFRQMAESIQEVFFLLDRETGRMLYLSPLTKSILGIPVSVIAEKPDAFFDRMHPEDRERIGFFRDGAWYQRSFNEDFRFTRPDGAMRWLRLRSFLIKDEYGEVFRVAGVIGDITEYKTAQEEARVHQQKLIQADKMNSLGQMVSGVAHEINNPNNLIMLNGDVMDTFWKHMRPVLREHVSHNPDWKLAGIPYGIAEGKFETLLGGVSGGAKRIKRIVENLKDFARIDGGDLSESVAMNKVVEASIAIVENLIRKSTDRFTIVNGEELPRVRGNFQKLEQVVINLITNACQALESRSKAVRVVTWHESESGMVGIRVEDEGRGIPAGLLDKVADPFFTTKRDTGGTGLGLSVSYGIVREHRGRIEFTSEERRGTTVEIRIPAIKETA
jgi:PAS domain S-box-containing protein